MDNDTPILANGAVGSKGSICSEVESTVGRGKSGSIEYRLLEDIWNYLYLPKQGMGIYGLMTDSNLNDAGHQAYEMHRSFL